MIHSAATAYRTDLTMRSEPFGPHDGAWITVATLLEHATAINASEGAELVRDAVELAHEILGESTAFRTAEAEWGLVERGPSEAIVLLADEVYESGALHLARTMLDALLVVDTSLSVVQRGRVLARRARIDGRLGRMEEAADQYREVDRLGKEHGSDELRARAYIGRGALAQMRGNYPEQKRFSRRAARLADGAQLTFLSRLAHTGLMIAAGAQHRFDEAMRHASIVYRSSLGDPLLEGEILQNIGQLLLEAGHPDVASEAFAGVLSRRLPVRVHLPALGGLAVANAALRNVHRVLWAVAQLERLEPTSVPPYALAISALECASALTSLHRERDAARMLSLAIGIAEEQGYYEVIVKADELRRATAAEALAPRGEHQPLGRAGSKLVREIRSEGGAAERLPDTVVSVTALP